MKSKLLLILAALSFSASSLALTAAEEAEYKERVSGYNIVERTVFIAYNTATTVGACGYAGLYTAFSVAADTVPVAAQIQEKFLVKTDENEAYGYTGGVGALVVDLLTYFLDIADGEVDEEFFEETIKAYDDTAAVIDAANNEETGYCTKQAKQLVILLGLR